MTRTLPGFYPILDTKFAEAHGVSVEDLARSLVRAGVGIAQFRHKGPFTRAIFEQAARVGRFLQKSGVLFIVNDRADIALILGADGVHVGRSDLPPDEVRRLIENSPIRKPMLIGCSTHNERQLRAGDLSVADYLAIGPIFTTQSKENPDPIIGLDELRRLRGLTEKPLVAIGGINRENVGRVCAAGADSVAVISDFVGPDVDDRLREWVVLSEERRP